MRKLSLIGLYEITLDGSNVDYHLKRSFRARRMRLEISMESGLSVIVPRRFDISLVERFLFRKRNWIIKKLKELKAYQAIPDSGKLEYISYLGRPIKLVKQKSNLEYAQINIEQDMIIVNADSRERTFQVLKDWYLREARELITEKTQYFSKLVGVSVNNISVKSVKTRWGSCSRLGNLSFNWKLIMIPETIIDYVITHELCHLKRMDHSKLFWKLVEQYSPECHQHRKWLKQHEIEINRMPFK